MISLNSAKVINASRRASWWAALAAGAWLAWSAQPLTVDRVVRRAVSLQYSYADVFSELHEQPFAYCDSYYSQREVALAKVRARASELNERAPLAVWTMARDYDAIMGPHYEEDCTTAWRYYENPANFQKVFTQDYQLYFAVSELNLTEIHLAILQIVASWAGTVALALLFVYFWRSPLALIAGPLLTSVLAKATFLRPALDVMPGVAGVAITPSGSLYPALTVLLIIAMVRPAVTPGGWLGSTWATVCLAIVYGLHAMPYYVVDPPVARMFALIGVLYIAAVGVAYRRWIVVAGAVLAAAVQLTLDRYYQAPGLQIYSAVTNTNHLASAAYTNIMIYMGLLERPSPFGLFYMDEIFSWFINQDPVLAHAAPAMAVHHSYQQLGATMMWNAISSEPRAVLDAIFRRLMVQVFYRELWFTWKVAVDWGYTVTLLSMFAVNAAAWVRRPWFVALTPLTLCIGLNQFAINTAMTLVHPHARWNILGVMLMFVFAPLYLFVAVKLVTPAAWRWTDWRPSVPVAAGRSHRLKLASAVLAVAAIAVLMLMSVKVLRNELEYVKVWAEVHQPPESGVNIDGIVARLEALRTASGDRDGRIAMWIAAQLYLHTARQPIVPAGRRERVDDLRHTYFRLAVALAPDNERYAFAARFLRIDDWETYLLQGLQRFPNSVYAPGAAAALKYDANDVRTREAAVPEYERLVAGFLSSGASRIPGFESVPTVQGVIGAVTTERNDSSGLVLKISPGAVVHLANTALHGSTSLRIVCYLNLLDGSADAGVALGRDGEERRLATVVTISSETQKTVGRYQILPAAPAPADTAFGVWLRGGPRGATVQLRDYYPIVDNPKHYYRSGLMDRVRERTTLVTKTAAVSLP